MAGKVTVRARVQVLVDVVVGDTWSGDCPTEQVFEQAAAAALGHLRTVLQGSDAQGRIEVAGVPKVTVVMAERSAT